MNTQYITVNWEDLLPWSNTIKLYYNVDKYNGLEDSSITRKVIEDESYNLLKGTMSRFTRTNFWIDEVYVLDKYMAMTGTERHNPDTRVMVLAWYPGHEWDLT